MRDYIFYEKQRKGKVLCSAFDPNLTQGGTPKNPWTQKIETEENERKIQNCEEDSDVLQPQNKSQNPDLPKFLRGKVALSDM